MRSIQSAVQANDKDKLFAWFVFLGTHGASAETKLGDAAYEFARANNASGLPVSVLDDPQGPPGYLISSDAEVTVLMFRKRKVIANRSYRAADWDNRAADAVIKELPALFGRTDFPAAKRPRRSRRPVLSRQFVTAIRRTATRNSPVVLPKE